ETQEHNSQGDWGHEGKHGTIPAADVAGLPEYHQKEVYGHTGKTTPQTDNCSPEFQKKGHAGFVLKHTNGKKSFVSTEGYGYARYHAPVDDAAGDGEGRGEVKAE
ncbi:hypothetical protein H4F44_25120, partial [Escherichia coli]|uniref:hypothetical protein n=1 Tax=Escherichia coli TaxID=562 RepID=UPI0019822281